jgi:hypothetical protein
MKCLNSKKIIVYKICQFFIIELIRNIKNFVNFQPKTVEATDNLSELNQQIYLFVLVIEDKWKPKFFIFPNLIGYMYL